MMLRARRRPGRSVSLLYASTAGVILYLGATRLLHPESVEAYWFTITWSGFVLLFIAANLWFSLGVDQERTVGTVTRGGRASFDAKVERRDIDGKNGRQRARG